MARCSKRQITMFVKSVTFSLVSQLRYSFRTKHTIYALSSGFGKCGVAVVRISGPNAKQALTRMCKRMPHPRSAELRKIMDPETREVLDHGLVLWFPGPSSFTGEDCCEFQVHGGSAVLASVFSALSKLGDFRPAEPGEFARRAFYGGKLDLTFAEGLADLINAETEYQRKQAVIQMEGALCDVYTNWRTSLSKCVANIEAYIDFEEDQNIESSILNVAKLQIAELRASIRQHLADGRRGKRIKSGVKMAIIGAPNVGKSSLLNYLSQKSTAIVSDIAGTTRDVIRTDIDLCGFPVNVQDTAGLRDGMSDEIELEGMARARAALELADVVLIIVDATYLSDGDAVDRLVNYVDSLGLGWSVMSKDSETGSLRTRRLVVVNKIDLVENLASIQSLREKYVDIVCPFSCKTEAGKEELMASMSNLLQDLCGNPSMENPSFTQPRHRFCLQETLDALDRFSNFSVAEIDIGAQEVRNALHSLGKITRHVSTEDILDLIFRDFCIGK